MSIEQSTTANAGPALPQDPAPPMRRRGADLRRWQATPVIGAVAAVLLLAGLVAPRMYSPASIIAIVIPTAILAIAGIGQTLVVQQKGIDLSVGGIITLSATTLATLTGNGTPLWQAAGVTGALALGAGLVNGLLVTRLHITPILATLASNSLLIGLVFTIGGGSAKMAPSALVALASEQVAGVPVIGWLAVALIVAVAAIMSFSVFGRRFAGVGANPAAARATGVLVERHIMFGYVASSVTGALAGVLLSAYAGQVTYDLGTSYMLPVIAAVVVGGASLSGGRGSVVATAFAALLLTVVVQMVLTLGAPQSVQLLVQSAVLAVAAAVRFVPWHRLSRRSA